MNKRDCCHAVFAALEGAHDENGIALEIGEIAKKRLECACSIIATMSDKEEVELAQTVVSPAGISIILECDFQLSLDDGRTHPFFSLIRKFDKFAFSKAREDRLRITLTMDKLWVN